MKPDNIVLTDRAGQKDWVEVLDFGIAKRSSEHDPNEAKLTQQGMVLGTPPYMSPEQFTGQPVDVRSDIYALGVMTYEMLVGKYPFEANTAWEWASKHMTEPPRPIETQPLGPNVPDRMRAAVTRALAKNKEERFASVREFFEALAGGAEPATVSDARAQVQAAVHAPTGGDAMPRAKTEMAQPVMGGGPPPYGAPMGGAPIGVGAAPAISVPQGPMHTPKKSGGNGLVIGLAALAVLLLGGGIAAFALGGKPKPVPTTAVTDIAAASAATPPTSSSAAALPEEPVGAVTTTDPLGGTVVTPTGAAKAAPAGGGKSAPPIPTPKIKTDPAPSGKGPTPTPTPKADPPICAAARSAAARKSPAAESLAAQCRAAGGTP